jgi:hypothetical protein
VWVEGLRSIFSKVNNYAFQVIIHSYENALHFFQIWTRHDESSKVEHEAIKPNGVSSTFHPSTILRKVVNQLFEMMSQPLSNFP